MLEKKTTNGTDFEIDWDNFTAKVLNPVNPEKLPDEHIFPNSGNVCLSIIKNNGIIPTREVFIKALNLWAERHMYFRKTGFWINGHSHNQVEAAKECVYKILHTNPFSIKRMIKQKEYQEMVLIILEDLAVNEDKVKMILKEWLNE